LKKNNLRSGFIALKVRRNDINRKIEKSEVVQKLERIEDFTLRIAQLESKIAELELKKSNIKDFVKLEESLDKHRAKEVFKDTQIFVQGQLHEIEQRIHVDKLDTVDRINEVIKILTDKAAKSEVEKLGTKLKRAEKYITQVTINA
jgi:hypothetical protein